MDRMKSELHQAQPHPANPVYHVEPHPPLSAPRPRIASSTALTVDFGDDPPNGLHYSAGNGVPR
jgi:hypothetical protein